MRSFFQGEATEVADNTTSGYTFWGSGQPYVVMGEAVVVDDEEEEETEPQSGFTFSSFKNENLLDWQEEPYLSYLTVAYLLPTTITNFWTPYIYTFLENEETIVTDSGDTVTDSGEQVVTVPSLLMQTYWDWASTKVEFVYDITGELVTDSGDPVWILAAPDSMQVYRHRDGYLTSVAKNRVRGRGKSLQLHFESEGPSDFNLLGWGIYLTVNKN